MEEDLTLLLNRLSSGEPGASDAVWALVYDHLRNLAQRQMSGKASGHSIQPTMIVHEAWLKLAGKPLDLQSRQHFFALASRVMRAVVVDAARKRNAAKRGGDLGHDSLSLAAAPGSADPVDVLVFNETLERLAAYDERMARIVELRVFGGLTHAECADVLGCTSRVVEHDWNFVKLWLYGELNPESS